jgi:hypothetical protein
MPVLVMSIGKVRMMVPERLVPMLVRMWFGSVPLLTVCVLMVLIVLM